MQDGTRSPLTDAPSLTSASRPLAALSDDDLLRRLTEILSQSRRAEADLVAHIGEVDERRLYAREAFPSMFAYCTGALHLSEGEAYLRIAVARATREHPILLAMLAEGRLHLSGIAQLASHLTAENRETLLRRATHRSKRQIEELIAEVAPRKDVPALIQKLPDRFLEAPALSGMGESVTQNTSDLVGGSPGPASASSMPLRRRCGAAVPAAGPAGVPPPSPLRHGRRPPARNIRLMCHRHNTYLAEHDYGQGVMRRFSRSGRRPSGAEAVASASMTAGPVRPPPPGS